MGKDKKSEKKVKKLSDKECFSLALEHEAEKAEVKLHTGRKDKIKKILTDELARRGSSGLTQAKTGLQITFVQATKTIYDGEGIRHDKKIKESIKKRIFRILIDFSQLPKDRRDELTKAMFAMLTPAEKKLVTIYQLDEDAMSQEVQADRLDVKLIAPYTEIKKNEPYVNISLGGAK